MISVSNQAIGAIKNEFPSQEGAVSLRVQLQFRGCGGPIFELHPGKSGKDDFVITTDNVTLSIEKETLAEFGGVSVQYTESHWGGGHFAIRPLVDLHAGSCGDCRC